MPSIGRHTLSLVLTVALLSTGAVAAADPGDKTFQEWVAAGSEAHQAGRLEECISAFQSAYGLQAEPELLFNVGACQFKAERHVEALGTLNRYLGTQPDEAGRKDAETLLTRIQTKLAAMLAAKPAPAAAPEPSAPTAGDLQSGSGATPSSNGLRIAGWVTLAGGGLVMGTGLALQLLALSDQAAVEGAGVDQSTGHVTGLTQAEANDRAEAAEMKSAAGLGLLVTGGVSLVVGVILLSLDVEQTDEPVSLGVTPGGVILAGRF